MKVAAPIREKVTTIADDGSRIFLHPADVRGFFSTWRAFFGWFLITVFFALPWWQIGGYPAIFLDFAARRFHFFGSTFAAQDMTLLFFVLVGMGLTGYLLTSLFGRLWCGWSCPHTVFLEQVFRRIERWIDGDAQARRKLDAADWTPEKIFKRGLKWGIYLLISFVLVHGVLAYFVSLPGLCKMVTHAPWENWPTFVFMVVATGIVFFNFTWFREQLCLAICPYGRLQSALQDDDTLMIGYDEKRGEPRGRPGTVGVGDCINCMKCVQVCPTGIDIRQGLQIECVGCANCIDACDAVMAKLGRKRGLIRYDSLNGLSGGKRRFWRPRVVIYVAILLIGGTVGAFAFSQVKPIYVSTLRMTGSPYYVDAENVRNQFFLRVVNKSHEPVLVTVRGMVLPQQMKVLGFESPYEIEPLGEVQRPLVLVMPKGNYLSSERVKIVVEAMRSDGSGRVEITHNLDFLGPPFRFSQTAKK